MRVRSSFLWKWGARLRGERGGTVETIRAVRSAELGNARDLHIWLPPGYRRGGREYPVIYMQDGQNLFDHRLSFAGAWELDPPLSAASHQELGAIVVGVSNVGADRIDEYSPFVDPKVGGGEGNRYVHWLIDTVKPLIDLRYRTKPDRANTGIGGASMGGLISLYAFFRHPSMFGFVAALSPSAWFADSAIFPFVESAAFVPGRIYLDAGGREDARIVESGRRLRDVLLSRGYEDGRDLLWVEDPAGRHHESDWGRRFGAALPFLLTPTP